MEPRQPDINSGPTKFAVPDLFAASNINNRMFVGNAPRVPANEPPASRTPYRTAAAAAEFWPGVVTAKFPPHLRHNLAPPPPLAWRPPVSHGQAQETSKEPRIRRVNVFSASNHRRFTIPLVSSRYLHMLRSGYRVFSWSPWQVVTLFFVGRLWSSRGVWYSIAVHLTASSASFRPSLSAFMIATNKLMRKMSSSLQMCAPYSRIEGDSIRCDAERVSVVDGHGRVHKWHPSIQACP